MGVGGEDYFNGRKKKLILKRYMLINFCRTEFLKTKLKIISQTSETYNWDIFSKCDIFWDIYKKKKRHLNSFAPKGQTIVNQILLTFPRLKVSVFKQHKCQDLQMCYCKNEF